jgi:CheY-like chemotaxis protein
VSTPPPPPKLLVLIVEDEPFIAFDLALSVEDAGGVVAGPVGSVREALALLSTTEVAGAILDVHLSDRDVTPVAELLISRGVPIVFQSGIGLPPALRARYPDLPVFSKPVISSRLVETLMTMIHEKKDTAELND